MSGDVGQGKNAEDAFIVTGTIIHSTELKRVDIIENHLILVKNGKIICLRPVEHLEQIQQQYDLAHCSVLNLQPGEFLMPGMIDTHIHAPQYPNIGLGYDKQLLNWLKQYTFPLERKYDDVEFAERMYKAMVRHSVVCGTTTACYFATIHLPSCCTLTNIVEEVGQRALIGKVNMNVNSVDNYVEDSVQSYEDTEKFIEYVNNLKKDTILPVITPRFALSCDMDLMTRLGNLAKQCDVHIQTHISENMDEIKAVLSTFPDCTNYANVYDTAGLLTPKTILAHGIYLNAEEIQLLHERGCSISHCPNSNTSLRSGLCNVRELIDAGIKVGLGTDVSGGYSPSILNAMQNALSVSIHLSFMEQNLQPLTYHEVFYLATLGGAKALALDHKVGNFLEGKDFDALVINMKLGFPGDVVNTNAVEDLVQKFVYTGDDRNIVKVFVGGKQIK